MLTGNNGNQLAQLMHNHDLLKNGMSLDECEKAAFDNGLIPDYAAKWLKNDDFWEDFAYRMGELGYEVKC